MKTIKEKRLLITLLESKLERLTGKKVAYEQKKPSDHNSKTNFTEAETFDFFNDWEGTDIEGAYVEKSIDDLINKFKKLIAKEVEKRFGSGSEAFLAKEKATKAITKLWIAKIKEDLRF